MYLCISRTAVLKTVNWKNGKHNSVTEFVFALNINGQSQWPRGLRRRSTAARLLRSSVRIPPEAWMFVCCVCCVCQVEVSATGWSLVQRSPTDCGASLCVIKKPRERGDHSPRSAAEPEKITIIIKHKRFISLIYSLTYTTNIWNLFRHSRR
jgi:hypothetical protein